MTELPRYLPDEPWPAYAYHPGQDPHPTRDPAGHSHGVAEDESPAEPAEAWARSRRFLLGVDLFNHGYAWEAHEAWESMWLRPAERAQAREPSALYLARKAAPVAEVTAVSLASPKPNVAVPPPW